VTVPARHPRLPATLNTRSGEVTVRQVLINTRSYYHPPQGSCNSHLLNTHHYQLGYASCAVAQSLSLQGAYSAAVSASLVWRVGRKARQRCQCVIVTLLAWRGLP
jgi:hypothetical protein